MSELSKESRQRIIDAKIFKGHRVNFKVIEELLSNEHNTSIDIRTFERDIKELKNRIKDLHDVDVKLSDIILDDVITMNQ